MAKDGKTAQVLRDYHLIEDEAFQQAKLFCKQNKYPHYHVEVLGITFETITFKRNFGSSRPDWQIHAIPFDTSGLIFENRGEVLKERDELREELGELEKDCDFWESMHDDNVRKKRIGNETTKKIIADLREEVTRLSGQARCGHSPWPCKCDYQGSGFNPRGRKG